MAGGVFFNENDFFTCSSGLFPAQFASTSQTQNHSNDVKFLTVQDKVCRKQDFSCKWIVVLAAAIAALCVTGVGAMLVAALVGACIGLGLAMTLCGSMASMARNWLQPKTDVLISGNLAVTFRDGPLMTCSLFGGNIMPAPNIKHQWQALLVGGSATVMAGLEGFMYATAFRGAGTLLKSPATFFSNVGGNYLATLTKWGLAGRTVFGGYGAMQQHYVGGENDDAALGETFARGFAFELDMVDRWRQGNVHFQDIALIFSLGGIPAPPRSGNNKGGPENENNKPANEDGNPNARAAADAEANGQGGRNRAHEDVQRVTPESEGVRMLADNPELLGFYETALNRLAQSARDNAYKRYMRAKNNNFAGLTQDQISALCQDAWASVRSKLGDVATENGVTLDGEVHHWNYPKYDNPHDVLNPNHLTEAISREQHEALHRATTSDPGKIWEGPIDPNHALDIPPYDLPQPRP